MSDLTARDLELVALGAAMGSNCVPCIEYHIPESRKAGLTDPEIRAAIQHADKIRQVPARKTLQVALKLLPSAAEEVQNAGRTEGCGCGVAADVAEVEAGNKAQPRNMMIEMMAKMMQTCISQGQSAGTPDTAEKKPNPATTDGCKCG